MCTQLFTYQSHNPTTQLFFFSFPCQKIHMWMLVTSTHSSVIVWSVTFLGLTGLGRGAGMAGPLYYWISSRSGASNLRGTITNKSDLLWWMESAWMEKSLIGVSWACTLCEPFAGVFPLNFTVQGGSSHPLKRTKCLTLKRLGCSSQL